MAEQKTEQNDASQVQSDARQENILQKKKQDRGIQQLSLDEYQALKKEATKKAKKPKKTPPVMKLLVAVPVGGCCLLAVGLIFFLAFRMFTGN